MSNGNTRTEYNLKLALKEDDAGHVQKFLDCIESDYPVHLYKTTGYNHTDIIYEARAFITNKHMCSLLYEEYGVTPRRYDPTKLLTVIPKELERYFILGVFDGDGSFTSYYGSYGDKMNVCFGGSVELLRFIENHLVKNGIIFKANTESGERKVAIRHKGKDGTWRSLNFAGKRQGMKIVNYLYQDTPIYLDRKYQKYLNLPYHE